MSVRAPLEPSLSDRKDDKGRHPPGLPSAAEVGRKRRLARLFADDGRVLIVGFDHGVWTGHQSGLEHLPQLAAACLEAGADALQLGPRALSWVTEALPALERGFAAVVRLDHTQAWDQHRTAPAASTAIIDPQAAVAAGAVAAACFFLHDPDDPATAAGHAAHLAQLAARCQTVGLPLLVEALALGPEGTRRDGTAVLDVARQAFELGADALKIDHPDDGALLRVIIQSVGIPVLVRGGRPAASPCESVRAVGQALDAGASGIVFGRTIWTARNPIEVLLQLRAAVHGRSTGQG